jgi:hypothetical protein
VGVDALVASDGMVDFVTCWFGYISNLHFDFANVKCKKSVFFYLDVERFNADGDADIPNEICHAIGTGRVPRMDQHSFWVELALQMKVYEQGDFGTVSRI